MKPLMEYGVNHPSWPLKDIETLETYWSKFEAVNQWIITDNGKIILKTGAMMDWDASPFGELDT